MSKGGSAILGHVVTNPTVTEQWYKYDNAASATKRRVLGNASDIFKTRSRYRFLFIIRNRFHTADVAGKYRINMDGQLQIMNFDPAVDSAVYECEYSAGSTTLNVSSYELSVTGILQPLGTGTFADVSCCFKFVAS